MDPTMTEHDFRFPRRPHHPGLRGGADDDDDDGSAAHQARGLNAAASELTQAVAVANNKLLGSALFPSLDNAGADSSVSIDQLHRDDPLAAQVWKFYTKTKLQLPNQQRLENFTWRWMALNMRKQKQDDEARQFRDQQTGYVVFLFIQSHARETTLESPATAIVPAYCIILAGPVWLTRGLSHLPAPAVQT